jgi:hypothetical protein
MPLDIAAELEGLGWLIRIEAAHVASIRHSDARVGIWLPPARAHLATRI